MLKYKIRNFCSGPAHLPEPVLLEAEKGLKSFEDSGLSILEIYHRDKRYLDLLEEAKGLVNELCNLHNQYHILFLHGGASSLFGQIPANILQADQTAAFVNTGRWAEMAKAEASIYGTVEEWGSSKPSHFDHIPSLEIPSASKASYLHITTNNTVVGTQYHSLPKISIPLIADMSSDILSGERDYRKFYMAYAGAQKNLGTAGVCLLLIRKDGYEAPVRALPRMDNFQKHIEAQSNLNTPPVFAIYICVLMLRWIKSTGLKVIFEVNRQKADTLYKEIDRNELFKGHARPESRSLMNPTFKCHNSAQEAEFLKLCEESGIQQIKGHRSIGGLRVALYNAIPLEWVKDLTELMKYFERVKG